MRWLLRDIKVKALKAGQITDRRTEKLWGRDGGHKAKEQRAADNLDLHLGGSFLTAVR